jgi:hypothetical protein
MSIRHTGLEDEEEEASNIDVHSRLPVLSHFNKIRRSYIYLFLAFLVFFIIIVEIFPSKATTGTKKDDYDPQTASLSELCNRTVWHKDIYLNCTRLAGGCFNIKSSIMTCIRWAIDSGVGMILPLIGTRAKTNPTSWHESEEGVSYLFDQDHMNEVLRDECPQLVIKDTFEKIDRKVYAEFEVWATYTMGKYKSHVDELIKANRVDLTYNNNPLAIVEDNPLLGWEFYKETSIYLTLYDATRFSPYLRSLTVSLLAQFPSRFIGFHLRAEKDQNWHRYEEIIPWFETLYKSKYSHIKTVYLAVGENEIAEKFIKETANSLDFKVVSKWSLAKENATLLKEFDNLRWDQLAVVDYEILKKTDHFFGVARSSFSYALAQDRGNGFIANCECNLYGLPDPNFVCCL